MLKESPDHHDADLILKIYDLRREAVMRESRSGMNNNYWPRSAEEAVAVIKNDHPLNAAYRQTMGYWEMVYGMARHGVVHSDFLAENNGEGFFLYARVEPFLAQIREASSPRAFMNTQWIVENSASAGRMMELTRQRVARLLKARG
ncbi:MAG: hypothetical protein ABJD11_03250 [Gemmatimonadota bacterium]